MYTLQLFSTLCMTGLIWMVQVVHYPLLAQVGEEAFPRYAQEHARRITWIVAPLMLVELTTAYLSWWTAPGLASTLGLGLVALLWLITALYFVPLHNRLGRGFDTNLHRALVSGNWVRTLLWTSRSAMLLFGGP